ncbi:MAG: hypothetical protein QXN90_03305 [Zestosphaera sp.]
MAMLPSASLKCLSRQELLAGNKLTLSFYKVTKEAKVKFSETSFEEVLKSRPSNLIKYKELRKICRNSDAALISGDGLTLFVSLKKVSPSIQLLKTPALVKEILIAKVVASNDASESTELEFTDLKLKTEKIELSEELIAFDSVVKGDLEDGIYALKIVSDKLDSVITKDEIRKYLSKQSKQLETLARKSLKKKKKRKSRRKKRKKTARKSR